MSKTAFKSRLAKKFVIFMALPLGAFADLSSGLVNEIITGEMTSTYGITKVAESPIANYQPTEKDIPELVKKLENEFPHLKGQIKIEISDAAGIDTADGRLSVSKFKVSAVDPKTNQKFEIEEFVTSSRHKKFKVRQFSKDLALHLKDHMEGQAKVLNEKSKALSQAETSRH
jgi:hypothetical protein